MVMKRLQEDIKKLLQEGTVIPAHPLALNSNRQLDESRQRQLMRYYMAAGAGGIAVAVHSTQFEIRDKGIDLLEPVLRIASEEIQHAELQRPFIKVAGIVGPLQQALQEAELASRLGYDLGLLSAGGLGDLSEKELIKRAEKVAEIIPVFGFYLQPAVGGRLLSFDFWKDFAEIPNVQAIKMAPFNRYQSLDVIRGVCFSSRYQDIALYTGNDDNIVPDLLTIYRFTVDGQVREKDIVGGLLAHWGVWTKSAVELLEEVKQCKREKSYGALKELLTTGGEITDTDAVIIAEKNKCHRCRPGIHELLRRQHLLEGRWCLNPPEELSPGQMAEIERIYASSPPLNDAAFARDFLNR